jgi:hypothetical protein
MSQFIYVFCQDDSPVGTKEIAEFIEEGSYFDNPPKISSEPASAQEDGTGWTELKIEYKARKRPVILHRGTRSEEFMEEVEEAIEALESGNLAENHSDLVSRLKGTKQLIVFELDSKGATEDCWEMVDNMEAWIAQERKGLIYVSGEGFYNAELEPICKL